MAKINSLKIYKCKIKQSIFVLMLLSNVKKIMLIFSAIQNFISLVGMVLAYLLKKDAINIVIAKMVRMKRIAG